VVEIVLSNGQKTGRRRAPPPHHAVAETPTAPPSELEARLKLQQQLAEKLVILRAEFQETVACYSVRIQSMLALVGDLLGEDNGKLSATERKARKRALRRVLDELDGLDLKPVKGRRRDLKVVEIFAAELCEEIAEW
jgi:hypothetical protein